MPEPTADTGFLTRAGLSEGAVGAVLRVDALMQNWRRKAMRREIGQRALRELGIEIDLAQLDVLVAIDAPRHEFGTSDDGETMVATVAERLAIDPSRASRIVSEMMTAGYVVRVASRVDSRRTVLALTPPGQAIVDAVRNFRFLLLGRFLQQWETRELDGFLTQLERFSAWTDGSAGDSIEAEVGVLADAIAKAGAGAGRKTG